jgi:FAD/FMN-containing dehydrogenase
MAGCLFLNTRVETFIAGCRTAIGLANVLTEAADKARFEHDFWNQYKGRAAAVLSPTTTAQVAAVVSLAAKYGMAVVPQAGNTGLVNGGIPDASADQIVLSVEKLNRIRHVDPAGDYLIAEAGCILENVQKAATEMNRLFPLSLGSSGSCRIGGNLATNAGGLNVLRYGMARDLVLGLEVVLPDGTVLDVLKPLRKDSTGYDLKQLFIGSEGTLGIITAATLRLVARPNERVTLWLANTPEDAIAVFKCFREAFGELISAFELICSDGVEIAVNGLSGARRPVATPFPWHVLIDVAWTFGDGLRPRVETVLEKVMARGLCEDGTIAETEEQRANMWRLREGQSESARKHGYILRSDISVAIARIPELLHWATQWQPSLQPRGIRLLPFGHIGDGNLHFNFLIPENSPDSLHCELLDKLYDQVDRLDGSISAEHGVGRAKLQAVMARKSAPVRELSLRLKRALDPRNIMNPGVGLDKPEENL